MTGSLLGSLKNGIWRDFDAAQTQHQKLASLYGPQEQGLFVACHDRVSIVPSNIASVMTFMQHKLDTKTGKYCYL